jgi:DNA-binding CsgD family transcriptional regulator/tetratricopeptide (TPR) repeat protein
MRLSEKLAKALRFGKKPEAASTVDNYLLAAYRSHPERSAEHIKTLFRVTRQLWIDSRTKDAIPVLSKALHIAELSNELELMRDSNIYMANTFGLLARFEEADRHLRAANQLREMHNIDIPSAYYKQKGAVAAGLGREKEAFANFERSLAQSDTDPYRAGAFWTEYGFTALSFGRTKLAKAHFEHALLAARQNNVAWFVPMACLVYAKLLMWMGEHTLASEYLIEALSSDAPTPILEEMIAYVGIPLALHMKDEAILAKCIRPRVIDRVFLSGEPRRIGLVAAAFAQFYVKRGQNGKAQTLLHRAVEVMQNVAYAWELPLEIACCGAKADFPKARGLLEARIVLSGAQVAQAFLYLFDAFVAQHEGRCAETHTQARKAVACFWEFQWGKYAALARSLLPVAEQRALVSEFHHAKPFSDTRARITEREREVAALVLKGLTNRVIADALSITENTVEKHVASVMNKIGIRSRYQLADTLLGTTEV